MERHIDIEGGYNIRDLGGYKTSDGGTLKWRKIFRAGLLTHIKDRQDQKMIDMGLKSICDFRAVDEQAASPDCWYQLDQLQRYSLPIGEGRPDKFPWLNEESLEVGKGHHLYKANRSYVLRHSKRYHRFFEIIMEEDNYPLLFHCTAGKDRTGFGAVLLLSALGVDWETIVEDYLLTNIYLADFANSMSGIIAQNSTVSQEKIITIFQANISFLQGALDAIDASYGSIKEYMKKELSIGESEKDKLKSILVDY